MYTARVVDTQYLKGDSVKAFTAAEVFGYEIDGYILVRLPRFEGDPYILHRKTEVLVSWIYRDHKTTRDKRSAIMKAYNKSGQNMQKFTEAAYERFKEDLRSGKIVAKFSKFQEGDIFFVVR